MEKTHLFDESLSGIFDTPRNYEITDQDVQNSIDREKERIDYEIIPWNKGLKGQQVAWNKGLTKENDFRIAKIAEKITGDNNPGKKLSGRSWENILGPEKAKQRREENSKHMSKNRLGKEPWNKGKPFPQHKVECNICHKIGGITNMKRWHFSNCKKNSDRVLTEEDLKI